MTVDVRKSTNGPGWEVWNGTHFAGHFHTHREAWRRADELLSEPTSRQESQAEWRARSND